MKLSIDQYSALDFHRNWVLRAGAGSGKTSVLTARFIHLLNENKQLKINEILALTFTQKAAEEMKSRVYREILSMVHSNQSMIDEVRDRFFRLKEEFPDNQISTFHAFCFSTLLSSPVEAGIDPYIRLLGEFERQQLLQQSYQEVLQGFIRRPGSAEMSERNRQFMRLLECWEEKQIRKKIFTMFQIPRHYLSFVKNVQKISSDPTQFVKRLLKVASERTYQLLLNDDFVVKIQSTHEKALEKNSEPEFIQLLYEILGALNKVRSPDDLFNLTSRSETWLEHESVKKQHKVYGAPLTAVQIQKHIQASGLPRLQADLDQHSLVYLSIFILFANEVYLQYQRNCKERHLLDFDRLQLKTLELLRNNQEILLSLRNKYKFILVDEFQDTDPTQWEILKLLVFHEDQYKTGKMFIVGDEKQAIYGFRGGDIEIFRQASKALLHSNAKENPIFFERNECATPENLKYRDKFYEKSAAEQESIRLGLVEFQENYRSHKILIYFFNAFFKKLFTPDNDLDPSPQNLFCMKNQNEFSGEVRILLLRSENAKSPRSTNVPDSMWEARMMAEFVQNVLASKDEKYANIQKNIRQAKPGIGILFRRFTQIKVFEEIFRQQGIDFFVHRGKGFFRRQEILDLYNALEFLNDTRKDIPLMGLLRSPCFSLKDQEIFDLFEGRRGREILFYRLRDSEKSKYKEIYQKIQHWYQLKDRMRISELLRWIIRDTALRTVWSLGIRGKQTIFNVEKFIEMAREFESSGIRGLAEFCEYIRIQIARDEQEGEAVLDLKESSGVVFMTIHQSKGLEFPMVLLPDLNARFNVPRGDLLEVVPDTIIPGSDYFLGIKCPNPKKDFQKEPTIMQELLREKAHQRLLAEEKRLFYVGTTRAQEFLLLVGRERSLKSSARKSENKSIDQAMCIWDWLESLFDWELEDQRAILKDDGFELPISSFFRKGNLLKDQDLLIVPEYGTPVEEHNLHSYRSPISSPTPLRVSPTSLVTYFRCKRKFYFQKILGIPEFLAFHTRNRNMINVEEIEDANAKGGGYFEQEFMKVRGSLLGVVEHQLLEHTRNLNKSILSDQILKRLYQVMESIEPNLRSKMQVENLLEEIKSDILLFINESPYYSLFTYLEEKQPDRIFSEVPFSLPCGGVQLSGNIDKMFQEEKGGFWKILDFKTNRMRRKYKNDPSSLLQFIKDHHYDLQLNGYALAVENMLNLNHFPKLEVYFTHQNIGPCEISTQPHAVSKILLEMDQTIKVSEGPFPEGSVPLEEKLCAGCGYGVYKICNYPYKNLKEPT